jgi:hypothetical protein
MWTLFVLDFGRERVRNLRFAEKDLGGAGK